MHAQKQYLEEVRKEYEGADKNRRGRLLDEVQRRTKLNRKYLIRILSDRRWPVAVRRRRRRRTKYGVPVLIALVQVWEIFDYPSGQRLEAVLKAQVERLRQLGELRCSDQVAEQLGQISAKTIDRMLTRERRLRHLRRNRNPSIHPLLYQKVPVKVAAEWDTRQVGNLQLDYVAHCGRSTGGVYIHTLSAVDIASGWWEGAAIARRSQQASEEGLKSIHQRCPFRIREIHPDNDTGLINDLLWEYCRRERIRMSRSRPYQKNDNAWVEQKNWTHVRKVVGYRRYDTLGELALLNQIYGVLRLYKNFFQPVMKLVEKKRVAGKIHRVYDQPRTPYQRLLENRQVDRAAKQQLRSTYESLNPAELHRQLEELSRRLFGLAEGKTSDLARPRWRGPDIQLGSPRTAVTK